MFKCIFVYSNIRIYPCIRIRVFEKIYWNIYEYTHMRKYKIRLFVPGLVNSGTGDIATH